MDYNGHIARGIDEAAPVTHPEGAYFTVVGLPDTQKYSQDKPELFTRQTRWIREAKNDENIAVVLHEGDVVNGPAAGSRQFRNADEALRELDTANIPYVLAIGNHDYTELESRNTEEFQTYFPAQRLDKQNGLISCFENASFNAAVEFDPGSHQWIALSLELFPREEVLEWASEVLESHPDHRVALVTHGYLYIDGTRIQEGHKWTRQQYGLDGHNGDELWEHFVTSHPQIELVLSGHALINGSAYLQSPNCEGDAVHQMLGNFQSHEDGGAGYLILLRVYPEGNVLTAETYSPVLEAFHPDPGLHFRVDDAFGGVGSRSTGRFVRHRDS